MNEWQTWALGHVTNFGLNVLIVVGVFVLFALAIEGLGIVLFRLMKK